MKPWQRQQIRKKCPGGVLLDCLDCKASHAGKVFGRSLYVSAPSVISRTGTQNAHV